jgi:fucose permease
MLLSAGWALLINVGNTLVPEAFPGTEAQANNFANVFFGLGAFLTPLTVALALKRSSWTATLLGLAALPLILGVLALQLNLRVAADADAGGRDVAFLELLADPMQWVLGLALACYGPLEASMGAWTTTYLRERGVGEDRSNALLSGFWLAFMAARLAAALGLGLVGPGRERWLLLGLAIGCVAVLSGIVASRRAATAMFLVLAAGLMFGPIFPTLMGQLHAHFPKAAFGRAVGLFFAIGGLGWTFLPMLIGAYANKVGVQRAFVLAVAAACGLVGVSLVLLTGF